MAFYFVKCQAALLGFDRFHGHETATATAIDEVHLAGYLRVQSVIFTPANVQTGLQRGTTLAHNNGTTGDYLPGEDLDAQSLRVRVATIFRTA